LRLRAFAVAIFIILYKPRLPAARAKSADVFGTAETAFLFYFRNHACVALGSERPSQTTSAIIIITMLDVRQTRRNATAAALCVSR